MQVKKTVLAKRTIVLGVAGILLAGAAVAAVGVSIRSGQTIVGAFGPAGDVNGDGNTDLFVKVGQNVEIRPGTAQGVFSSTPIGRAEIPADYYQYVSPYSVGDVNGDGFDDVILAAASAYNGTLYAAGNVKLFLGSASGVSFATPALTLLGENMYSGLGGDVYSLGDVNHDGFDDVMIVAGESGSVTGGVHRRSRMHLGSASGLSSTPTWTSPYARLAVSDVNGDGFIDLVTTSGATGLVYQGSAAGDFSATPSIWSETLVGGVIASAGDVNNDGFGDILLGDPGYSVGMKYFFYEKLLGRASLYLGSPTGLSSTPVWTMSPSGLAGQAQYGAKLAAAGDVNGDGYGDVLIGAPFQSPNYFHYDNYLGRPLDYTYQEGALYLYLGTPTGLSASAGWTLAPNALLNWDYNHAQIGNHFRSLGDINKDGYSDFLVGTVGPNLGEFIFLGGAGSTTPSTGDSGGTTTEGKGRGKKR